uniref:Putative tail protein n=1 Tax=viral metagenome TaxID=1070528 RepID=A0A6M3J771_9ZZZZ
MKRKSFIIAILTALAALVSLGATLTWYGAISYDTGTGVLTFNKAAVFSSTVGMGATATQITAPADIIKMSQFLVDKDKRYVEAHDSDHTQVVVNKGGNTIPIEIGSSTFVLASATNVDINTDLDTGTVAEGTDYCVYAVNSSGALDFVISANTTWPDGYSASTSTKIGGFHTLCVSVGTISGHTLSGYVQDDILPASIWDLKHRPVCDPGGMVYSEAANIWVDIYVASGTGISTASAFGGTISDTRDWMDFVDDFHAVGKQLLSDTEFQAIAAGSNEETNIAGSADPVTTGGHSNTAGRRMISNIGVEDAAGAMWQWLRDQSYRFDAAANHTHQVTVSGDPETVTSGNPSGDVAPALGWYDLPGSKGSLYRQGSYGDTKLHAGGDWNDGSDCGSRGRRAAYSRWIASSNIGGRGRAEPK